MLYNILLRIADKNIAYVFDRFSFYLFLRTFGEELCEIQRLRRRGIETAGQ